MDIETENLLPLAQAAKEIPGRPHTSTVIRWAATGVKGVKLETVVVGGRRFTSQDAIRRFVARLNAPKALNPSKMRVEQIAWAADQLDSRGLH